MRTVPSQTSSMATEHRLAHLICFPNHNGNLRHHFQLHETIRQPRQTAEWSSLCAENCMRVINKKQSFYKMYFMTDYSTQLDWHATQCLSYLRQWIGTHHQSSHWKLCTWTCMYLALLVKAIWCGFTQQVSHLCGFTQQVSYLCGFTQQVSHLCGFTQQVSHLCGFTQQVSHLCGFTQHVHEKPSLTVGRRLLEKSLRTTVRMSFMMPLNSLPWKWPP